MTRAILAISGSAAALLPHPFTGLRKVLTAILHGVTPDAARHYRPELHYMRGPGPAWRAKHGQFPSA